MARKAFMQEVLALEIAAVILFERYEQKDKSGKNDPAPSLGNAQIKLFKLPAQNLQISLSVTSNRIVLTKFKMIL
jgi:hypothetical protein